MKKRPMANWSLKRASGDSIDRHGSIVSTKGRLQFPRVMKGMEKHSRGDKRVEILSTLLLPF